MLAAHHTNSNGASLAANPKPNRLQGIDGNLQSSPQSSTRLLMRPYCSLARSICSESKHLLSEQSFRLKSFGGRAFSTCAPLRPTTLEFFANLPKKWNRFRHFQAQSKDIHLPESFQSAKDNFFLRSAFEHWDSGESAIHKFKFHSFHSYLVLSASYENRQENFVKLLLAIKSLPSPDQYNSFPVICRYNVPPLWTCMKFHSFFSEVRVIPEAWSMHIMRGESKSGLGLGYARWKSIVSIVTLSFRHEN
jgi:hypothetical protein